MNLVIAVVLTAAVMGLGWAFFAALGAVLRRLGAFPAGPFPVGPAAGHCPSCGCAVYMPVCDGGGACDG